MIITISSMNKTNSRRELRRKHAAQPLNSALRSTNCRPDIRHLMKIPEDDRDQIFRLFSIRVRLWQGEPLPVADRQFSGTTHSQVPSWAVAGRLCHQDESGGSTVYGPIA
jgi:hypothetical protein